MRAMVLRAPGEPLEECSIADPVTRAGTGAAPRARLRRLPHRPPRRRRRADAGRSCRSCPATRSSARSRGDGRARARVGVPWLGWTCGECRVLPRAAARTCATARASPATTSTAATRSLVADERFCFPIPDGYADLEAAPLLCAGLIGYRALRLAGDAERLGLYGFGAAAHIVCQIALAEGRGVFAVTRQAMRMRRHSPDRSAPTWAGSGRPPEELDAAIIFAPAGELVPAALAAVARAAPSCAPVSTCPTSHRSPTSCSGASEACAPSRTSRAATARSSSRSHPKYRCGRRSRPFRSAGPRKPSRASVVAPCAARCAGALRWSAPVGDLCSVRRVGGGRRPVDEHGSCEQHGHRSRALPEQACFVAPRGRRRVGALDARARGGRRPTRARARRAPASRRAPGRRRIPTGRTAPAAARSRSRCPRAPARRRAPSRSARSGGTSPGAARERAARRPSRA